MARLAMTSLAFMFVEVPDPVWKTSSTNWSSSLPSATSWAACCMGSDSAPSRRPSSTLTWAAAILIRPIAWDEGSGQPEIADGEVKDRPHGLRAVVGAGRYGQLAHGVSFDSFAHSLTPRCPVGVLKNDSGQRHLLGKKEKEELYLRDALRTPSKGASPLCTPPYFIILLCPVPHHEVASLTKAATCSATVSSCDPRPWSAPGISTDRASGTVSSSARCRSTDDDIPSRLPTDE